MAVAAAIAGDTAEAGAPGKQRTQFSKTRAFRARVFCYSAGVKTDPLEDYARGWVPFLDCKIFLDSRPLIPRLETEYWVEKAIAEMRAGPSAPRVLDLFAGSGAIGVAALKHLPGALVDFGEIDERHFPTIKKNVIENAPSSRAQILSTDVWSGISDIYEFVLANPPYLAKELGRTEESVLATEPEHALFAEDGGFALIRKTAEGLRSHLAASGALFIEHEPEHAERLLALAASLGLVAENRKDQFGVLRWSRLRVA